MKKTSQSREVASPQVERFVRLFRAAMVLIIGGALGYFVFINATQSDARYPFKLGLDLAGGSHLVYEADVTKVEEGQVSELMGVLRDVIERRINVLGVSEPIIQVEESSFAATEKQHRLVVELPGVTDVDEAINQIGKTPLLEFKLVDAKVAAQKEQAAALTASSTAGGARVSNIRVGGEKIEDLDPYIDTGLTGRYLESASVELSGQNGGGLANQPLVAIKFNAEGAALFEKITREHVGENLAIFLDGEVLSAPRINEAISGGRATISGSFTPDKAKELAHNLSFGALPVPIKLVSTQTIDATLGVGVIHQSLVAGIAGFLMIAFFLIFWYRLPGFIATVALLLYIVINLMVFMLIPVTLTAAGLAGFILSLGMAVDANVLVFERMKEEYRSGKASRAAAEEGFKRAWSAIRDGNVTGLISAVILFWFGTAMIKGFALVLAVGIVISVVSAIFLTRTFLIALPDVRRDQKGFMPYLFGTGLSKK